MLVVGSGHHALLDLVRDLGAADKVAVLMGHLKKTIAWTAFDVGSHLLMYLSRLFFITQAPTEGIPVHLSWQEPNVLGTASLQAWRLLKPKDQGLQWLTILTDRHHCSLWRHAVIRLVGDAQGPATLQGTLWLCAALRHWVS